MKALLDIQNEECKQMFVNEAKEFLVGSSAAGCSYFCMTDECNCVEWNAGYAYPNASDS